MRKNILDLSVLVLLLLVIFGGVTLLSPNQKVVVAVEPTATMGEVAYLPPTATSTPAPTPAVRPTLDPKIIDLVEMIVIGASRDAKIRPDCVIDETKLEVPSDFPQEPEPKIAVVTNWVDYEGLRCGLNVTLIFDDPKFAYQMWSLVTTSERFIDPNIIDNFETSDNTAASAEVVCNDNFCQSQGVVARAGVFMYITAYGDTAEEATKWRKDYFLDFTSLVNTRLNQ